MFTGFDVIPQAVIASGTELPTGAFMGTCTRINETPVLPGINAALLTGAQAEPICTITPRKEFPGELALAGCPSAGPSF
jgi:hypothetical protein